MATDIKIKKGNQYNLQLTATKDGVALDISASEVSAIVFAILDDPGTAIGSALFSASLGGQLTYDSDGTDGIVNVDIQSTDTTSLTSGFYYYVLQITLTDGNIIELPDETAGEIQLQEQLLTNP